MFGVDVNKKVSGLRCQHLQLLKVFHLGEGVSLDGHDAVIAQISMHREKNLKKKEKKQRQGISTDKVLREIFCRHFYNLQKQEREREKTKLWATDRFVNQKWPDSELLWALALVLIRIKCSCWNVIHTYTHSCLHFVSLCDRYSFGSHVRILMAAFFPFFLTPHQSRGKGEDGLDAWLKQTLFYDSARFVYGSDFWKQSVKHEADSQVLQLVQAWEGFFGHRANLVPLQEPGRMETKGCIRLQDLSFYLGNLIYQTQLTYSVFILSRAENGPFMSSIVQEISLFWRSL